MKVYSCPEGHEVPQFDFRTGREEFTSLMKEHQESLRGWLKVEGFTGPHSGGICAFQVADGYATYMLAEAGSKGGEDFLIHLPYLDGYQMRHVEHFPKEVIVEEIERKSRLDALFARA